MNSLEYKAVQINKIIKGSDLFKNFKQLEAKVIEKYETTEDQLKAMQQQLVVLGHLDPNNEFDQLKDKYITQKESFENDPLVISYLQAKEEISNTIDNLKLVIESGI